MIYILRKKKATNSIIRNSSKLELNSLYGKFGQKDSSSIMKIIRKDDVDKFTKNYNFQSICELNDDLVLIKYNSRMNEKIRNLLQQKMI